MLVVQQIVHVLHCPNLLLCSVQMQLNSVIVNKMPKFFTLESDVTTHLLQASLIRDSDEFFMILLSFKGITSCFAVHKPTIEKWENKTA